MKYLKYLIVCVFVFCAMSVFCVTAKAELVEHSGLPNEEGVKPNPLKTGLSNPDLPNREGVKTGPAIMHADFTAYTQLDTNIFLEDSDAKFDVLSILNPSFGMELPLGESKISMDYDFSATIFAFRPNKSYIDHRARLLAEWVLTDYKISVANVYRYFSDRSGSEDVRRVTRQNNYARAGIAATGFDQLGFDLGYTFGVEDFISNNTLYTSAAGNLTYHDKNRLINVADLRISYDLLPKTTLFVESYIGWITYDSAKSSDSWYTETVIGVHGELSEKLSSDIQAGFRYQSYKDSTLTDSSNFTGAVVSGTLTYKRTEKDEFNLRLERSIYESTFLNMNYYNVNHAGLDYTHFFTKKVSANGFAYYQLNLYPSSATVDGVTAKRYDHLFGGGVGARYDMKKWTSCGVNYEFRQRISKFPTYDYVDHILMIRGTIGF